MNRTFRSASAAYPSGLDLRSQYRTIPSQPSGPPPPTPRSGSFVTSFSQGGFQSAPLSSPSEYQMPRTPIEAVPRDYHMGQQGHGQMSAPMAPPQDFASAYQQQQHQAGQQMSPARGPPAEREGTVPEGVQGVYAAQDTDGGKRKRAWSMGGGYEGHHP
jgi:hypothetical protein